MSTAKTVDELRRMSPSHVILSVEEARQRRAGGETFILSPLCGGMPPEVAWPYLKRLTTLQAARPDSPLEPKAVAAEDMM